MRRKGDCWDNAVAESFFHTLVEQTRDRKYKSRQETQEDIFEYIKVLYNRQRHHSYLGYLSPAEFEKKAHAFNQRPTNIRKVSFFAHTIGIESRIA